MTLVVARISGERIGIVSDTSLTEHGRRLGPQKGVLKSCMLPGGLCVSFANSPELAARDLEIYTRRFPQGADFVDAASFFEASSAATGNDYILASCEPVRLITIADGRRLAESSLTQWIGDRAAYERFREYEARHREAPDAGRAINAVLFADEMTGSPASDLYGAMRRVIADSSVESTSGFAYVLSNRRSHFRPCVYSDMLFNWPRAASDDYLISLSDRIDLGASGENKAYAIAQISPGYLGLNTVAFYILSARMVFVYAGRHNGLAADCIILRNVEPKSIEKTLAQAATGSLRWLMLVASCPDAALDTDHRPDHDDSGLGVPFFGHINTFPRFQAG